MGSTMKSNVIGTGSYVPPEIITNAALCDFVGREIVTPGWIEEKTRIQERRWVDFDGAIGRKTHPGRLDTDLAEAAARCALTNAGIDPREVDGLVVVTCTPDEVHFSYPATELHRRLGLSHDASAQHIDSGCAGIAYALDQADAHIQCGKRRTILVVASNLASAHVDRTRYLTNDNEWFPLVVFGDGAGALVLQATTEDDPCGVLALYCGADGNEKLMTYPAGGSKHPTAAYNADDHKYLMDARMVKRLFAPLLERSLAGLMRLYPFHLPEITRLYLHQANGNLVHAYANRLGIPLDHVPLNIQHYGNTSAASTLLLLDEERRAGRVHPGDLLLFLWVGAGAHYGGMLLRL